MDWNKIATLLHIVEKAAGHPQLKNISANALLELKKHNDGEYGPEGQERATEPAKPTRRGDA